MGVSATVDPAANQYCYLYYDGACKVAEANRGGLSAAQARHHARRARRPTSCRRATYGSEPSLIRGQTTSPSRRLAPTKQPGSGAVGSAASLRVCITKRSTSGMAPRAAPACRSPGSTLVARRASHTTPQWQHVLAQFLERRSAHGRSCARMASDRMMAVSRLREHVGAALGQRGPVAPVGPRGSPNVRDAPRDES